MVPTRNDLNRLIQFSLDKYKFETAVTAFPMFTSGQIRYIYLMSRSERTKLLKQRTTSETLPKQHRNPEHVQKMADIATDPSNR